MQLGQLDCNGIIFLILSELQASAVWQNKEAEQHLLLLLVQYVNEILL